MIIGMSLLSPSIHEEEKGINSAHIKRGVHIVL